MLIHDYTSSKIHLNELKIEKIIKKNVEEKYSSSSKIKIEASSFNAHNLIRKYINPLKPEDISKKLIEDIINEDINNDNNEDEKDKYTKENNLSKNKKNLDKKIDLNKIKSDKKNEQESEIINQSQKKNFENFIKTINNPKLNKDDLALIEKIYYKNNSKEFNINALIELYNNNSNEINKKKYKTNNYQNEINHFNININEEFLIENILKNYKRQFGEK